MTPGPHNETYFEHLYLANYLDYTLIEGANLTVRDGRVWLKSVSGLAPVDVILRRVDDHYCDPLELRPDSLLGVPGTGGSDASRTGCHRQSTRRGHPGESRPDGLPAPAGEASAGTGTAAALGRHLVVRTAAGA